MSEHAWPGYIVTSVRLGALDPFEPALNEVVVLSPSGGETTVSGMSVQECVRLEPLVGLRGLAVVITRDDGTVTVRPSDHAAPASSPS